MPTRMFIMCKTLVMLVLWLYPYTSPSRPIFLSKKSRRGSGLTRLLPCLIQEWAENVPGIREINVNIFRNVIQRPKRLLLKQLPVCLISGWPCKPVVTRAYAATDMYQRFGGSSSSRTLHALFMPCLVCLRLAWRVLRRPQQNNSCSLSLKPHNLYYNKGLNRKMKYPPHRQIFITNLILGHHRAALIQQ